jgi:hypothetical protein
MLSVLSLFELQDLVALIIENLKETTALQFYPKSNISDMTKFRAPTKSSLP